MLRPSVTFDYLLRAAPVGLASAAVGEGDAWLRFLVRDARIKVIGESLLRMPKTPQGVPEQVRMTFEDAESVAGHPGALRTLLTDPAFVAPHPEPDVQVVIPDLDRATIRRDAKVRRVTLARAIKLVDPPEEFLVGFAELVVIEGGLSPGHSLVAQAGISWHRDFDDLASRLRTLRDSCRREAWGAPSRRVVFIGSAEATARPDWRNELAMTAGVYGVELTCLPDIGSHMAAAAATIAKDPPQGLYIWRPRAAKSHVLEERYAAVRPQGDKTEITEPQFEDMQVELQWALQSLVLGTDSGAEGSVKKTVTWETVHAELIALNSTAFVVREQALRCCDGNGYLHPGRMLEHIATLARAAEDFARLKGTVGGRIAQWLQDEYGLDVALTDDKQQPAEFTEDGRSFNDLPHVKVDDAKALNECGRIHFAIDAQGGRLLLNYFGPHR